MIEIYVFTAIALVAAGVMIGVLAVVSLGIRRGVRRVTGAGARAPRCTHDAGAGR